MLLTEKKVLRRGKDILEVKNAVRAYNLIKSVNLYYVSDLFRVH